MWGTVAIAAPPENDAWPQQGGPNRDYVLPARPLDVSAVDGKATAVYRINAGFGIAQPVEADGKLYTYGFYPTGTTAESIVRPSSYASCADAFSNPKKLPELIDKDIPDSPAYATHYSGPRGEEWAVCWDAATGAIQWASRLTDEAFVYRQNNIVSDEAAPLLHHGKLYVHILTGRLFCLNPSDGKIEWDRNLYETHMFQWAQKQGDAAGPVGVGDTVVVSTNGVVSPNYAKFGDSCMVAAGFDAATGRTRWVTHIPISALRPNNGRLGLTTIEGKAQILAPGGKGTAGLDPETGDVLWSRVIEGPVPFPWTSYAPVAWHDGADTYVFDSVDAAHDDAQSQSWVLKLGGKTPDVIWATHDFKPYSMIQKANVVSRDGKIYGFDSRTYGNETGHRQEGLPPGRGKRPDSEGRFQCRDFKTGRLLWSSDDFGPQAVAQPHYLLLAGDLLFVTHSSGLYVGKLADGGITQVARLPFKNSGDMAEPVLVGSRLYLRQQDLSENHALGVPQGQANLFCIDLVGR